MTRKWWSAKGVLATKVSGQRERKPHSMVSVCCFLFQVVLSGCLARVCLSQLTDSSSVGSRLKLSARFLQFDQKSITGSVIWVNDKLMGPLIVKTSVAWSVVGRFVSRVLPSIFGLSCTSQFLFRKFILCEILFHFTSHPSYFVLFCFTRDACAEPRYTWSGRSPSWYQKDWKSSQASGDKEPEGSGSGATGTLGGRPLRKQAVRVPARRTNTAKIHVVKNTKVWLGKEPGANSSRSLRRISGDFRSFAQQERQSQQDPQSEYRSQRQSPRPQPEDNEGFGHSGNLVFYI